MCLVFALFCFSSSAMLGPFAVLFGLVVLAIAIVLFVTAHSNGVFFHSTGTGVLAARGAKSELPQIQRAGVEIGRLIFA